MTLTTPDVAADVSRPDDTPAQAFAVRFVLVVGLFFVTGACGLVYQQLWLRELSLSFGVTIEAVSTALAAFFGGLALGGYLAGRLAQRTRRPIAWYGALEMATGVLAILTPFALDLSGDIYVSFATNSDASLPVLTGVRFALTFLVLLVPATFMGASLPLIVSSSLLRRGALGSRIGVLYASNTAGAVIGTIVSGFWLIGLWGLNRTFLVAAVVNIVAGLVAVVAARTWDADTAEVAADVDDEPAPEMDDVNTPARRAVLAVFVVSGFVTLALEVVWFRQLVLFLESSTYAFTVMLATVLVGISLGSAGVTPLLKRRPPTMRMLAVVEALLGFAALGSFLALSKSFGVINRLGLEVAPRSLTVVVVASVLSMLPATLLMGCAFPIGLELWIGRDRNAAGERAGTFYACNVAAGIAGSLVAGFVMVPAIGTRASVMILSLLLVLTAVWLYWHCFDRTRATAASAITLVSAAVVSVALVPDPYLAVMYHRFPNETVVWKSEDAQTTVSIQQYNEFRIMYVDGQHQANTTPEMVGYHRLLGTLPVAVHPAPKKALVVGLGGGVSPGAMSTAPGLDVHVVELSANVVEGARYLGDVNNRVVDRPNVRITVDDGRNHLLVTDEQYDIITADVIPPTHAGAGKLWSVEYWQLTRRALAPGGIMVQWAPQSNTRDYAMVLRSFQSVFPHVTAWAGGTMLIGSNEPLRISPDALEGRLADLAWRAVLEPVGITDWPSFAGLFTAGPEAVRASAGDGPMLTDDRPRIEYYRTLPDAGSEWSPEVVPVSSIDEYLSTI
jgi:spermidine synthase